MAKPSSSVPLSSRSKVLALVGGLGVVLVAMAGCHGKGRMPAVGMTQSEAPRPAPKPSVPSSVRGAVLAAVGDRAVGPYLARREGSAMAGYLAFDDDGVRRLSVVPLTPSGELKSGSRALLPTPFDSTDLTIAATGGPGSGYALAFTALTERGKGLWALGVTEDGSLRGSATEVTRSANDIVWTELVTTPKGALILWAEQTTEGDAVVLAASLDPEGKLRGVPVRVVRGVVGWQVVPTEAGAQLAVVAACGAPKAGEKPPPAISLLTLDAEGRVERALPVVAVAAVTGSIELSREQSRTTVAWTESAGTEPEILTVTLDDVRGALPARRLEEGRDGASLVGLVSGPAGTVVAWERPVPEVRNQRRIYLSRLGDTKGRKPLRLELPARTNLELTSTPTGFAVLAQLRPCSLESTRLPEGCENEAFIPTLVRMDASLAPLQVDALRFGIEGAAHAWGLGCSESNQCLMLSASPETPSRIRAALVSPRIASEAHGAPQAPESREASRLADTTTVVVGEAVAHLAAAHLGDRTLLATLSSDVDTPGRGTRGANLHVRLLDERGSPLPQDDGTAATKGKDPTLLTTRALSVGGIAIAAAGRPEDGAAIAWVARENGDPEVHVTRLDARGRRTNDVQLTSARGDASDVALAWLGNAWMVAWVDGRHGNGEVYATKISPDLQRVVREERITNAQGDASGVRLLAQKDTVFLAWADSREAPREGFADIYVTTLRAHDAKRATDEVRLLPSVAHSRSPEMVLLADGVTVAWIEQAPEGAQSRQSSAYRAMIARVDGRGRPFGVPVALPMAGVGIPTALSLEATPTGLRGAIARVHADRVALDAFSGAWGSLAAFPLGEASTPPSSDIALLLDGGVLSWGEDGPSPADRRLRSGRVVWSRP